MVRLPKIIGDSWFNFKALKPKVSGFTEVTADELAGKAVLVDFWTYSCVNCQRTLPYLRDWWKKYKDSGLVIVGIHTPEFEFEKDPKNVERAIEDLGVEWPVVLDNDQVNWNNFSNHYWPAKYLFNKDGRLVYEHFGEGAYEETEAEIQRILKIKDLKLKISMSERKHGSVCFIPTPETYCGYERGRLANAEGYIYDRPHDYKAPKVLPQDSIALDGRFVARSQYVESAEIGAALLLHFRATEVNLVLYPAGDRAVAEIVLDGKKLKDVSIKQPTLYNLLKSEDLTEGILTIKVKMGNFRAYAFTFSGCEQ